MKIFLSITTSLLIIPLVILSQNTTITSFSKSKKQLAIVYQDNPITLYCGCSFKGKTPDFSPCGYVPKKNNKRANRIEWEQVVPAYVFGIFFSEWTVGHPKCVKKNGKNTKDEGVQVRSIRNSREWKQICTTSFQQLVKLMD